MGTGAGGRKTFSFKKTKPIVDPDIARLEEEKKKDPLEQTRQRLLTSSREKALGGNFSLGSANVFKRTLLGE